MYDLSHSERKKARSFDTPMRSRAYTDVVYAGGEGENLGQKMESVVNSFKPGDSEYNIYFGEMHGHTDLSDARVNIDTYFQIAKNCAKLDFCAISDHDHGGVASTEIWKKWIRTKYVFRNPVTITARKRRQG